MSIKEKIKQYQDYIDHRHRIENSIGQDSKRLNAIHQLNPELLQSAIDSVIEELEEQLTDDKSESMLSPHELEELKKYLEHQKKTRARKSQTPEIVPHTVSDTVALSPTEVPTILILTSEGGAGHKEAAADSERQYAKQVKKKQVKINKVFVLPAPDAKEKSWMQLFRHDFGKKGVKDWNDAQKAGDMKKIKSMVSVQWISEMLFGRNFEDNTFYELTKDQNTTHVIDTQAVNSHRIVGAVAHFNQIRANPKRCERHNQLVRFNNELRKIPALRLFALKRFSHEIKFSLDKKPIKIRKRMTDLPNNADHFFQSLKKINKWDLPYFELEAPHAPLLQSEVAKMSPEERRKADLDYYRKKCPNLFDKNGTPLIVIEFTDGPIKKEFLHYKEHPVDKNKDLSLNIKVAHQNELKMLKENGVIDFGATLSPSQTVSFNIPAAAKVQSIMLGSQAAVSASLSYVDTEIAAHTQQHNPSEQYLFVFCGKHEGPDSLFAQLNDKIQQGKQSGQIPSTLKIVPLTYQDADMIAPLYSRADEAFIRSGGISCMEIEAVAQGKVFIHSEEKGNLLTEDELLKAMLFWERGNAEHVMQVLGKDKKGKRRVQAINPESYHRIKLEQSSLKTDNHLKQHHTKNELPPLKRRRIK
ncbi:hypothetical protein [Candidatus Berkiella aquae]|uniref:Uncharacterized protein n=1 Tax=Candidatus Berkiella aquae TaxID=295108 RepID=A0A0Q9Z0E4_9GAMM|nr:hypothetical protein [Candidatus Berkiella aquae]MCS5711883.1 hypothetical protein [Candidatus Berkiella aquae]